MSVSFMIASQHLKQHRVLKIFAQLVNEPSVDLIEHREIKITFPRVTQQARGQLGFEFGSA